MKIAYLFYDRPNYCGGPLVFACRLLPELKRRGHDVTALIGYYNESPATPFLQQLGIEVRGCPWPRYTEDQVRWILRQLGSIDPDVFVPNMSVAGGYAARWVRKAGRPTVVSHLSEDEFNWGMVNRFVTPNDRWTASGLFCMSEESRKKIFDLAPTTTEVCVIPAGAPVPDAAVSQDGSLRMVYAGRIVQKQKRMCELVRAMERILIRYPTATAKIIGDGPQRMEIESFIEASVVGERFTLTGYVRPEDIQQHFQDCNVLVLLSDYEGVPGAVMDGMAAGLVPVCLDIPGGLRELVIDQQTGLLVSDRDSRFDDAIARLAADVSFRNRLAANARSHIIDGYSIKVSADRFESLFDKLTQAAGRRRPIRSPFRLVLPPVSIGIDREDIRRQSITERTIEKARRILRRTARSVSRLTDRHAL